MGHFPVEQWNSTSQIMEWPGTVRPAALIVLVGGDRHRDCYITPTTG